VGHLNKLSAMVSSSLSASGQCQKVAVKPPFLCHLWPSPCRAPLPAARSAKGGLSPSPLGPR